MGIDLEESVPSYFLCPITQDIMRDPVVAEDGHSYESSAILKWLSSHDTSPLTNQVCQSSSLLFDF